MKKQFVASVLLCLALFLLTGAPSARASYWPADDGAMPLAEEQAGHPAHDGGIALTSQGGALVQGGTPLTLRTLYFPRYAQGNPGGKFYQAECYILEAGNYYLDTDVTIQHPIIIKGAVSLCLNGNTVTLQAAGKLGAVFKLIKGALIDGTTGEAITQASLNLYDCAGGGKITGGHGAQRYDTYSDNIFTEGGGVQVRGELNDQKSIIFNMHGGEIFGNSMDSNVNSGYSGGGGVCVDYAVFNMYGGKISNNSTIGNGGGVMLSTGTFTMSGGEISENTAGQSGGGIYAYGTTIHISGGQISSNSAQGNGGGLYTDHSTMYVVSSIAGGQITRNSAGGQGGGVYMKAKFSISGAPQITGNTAGDASANLLLVMEDKYGYGRPCLTVDPGLDQSAVIGVSVSPEIHSDSSVWVTQKGGTQDYMGCFQSDDSGYRVTWNETDQYVQLTNGNRHIHDVPVGYGSGTEEIEFNQVITSNTKSLSPGHYYLIEDIELDNSISVTISDEHERVDICLNGHVIKHNSSKNGSVFTVKDKGTLNLYDCTPERTHDNLPEELAGITGGIITGGKGSDGGGMNVSPFYGLTFNMYGGTVAGNSATGSGGGVYINSAVFNMYGGEISRNRLESTSAAPYAGGGGVSIKDGINKASTFNMYGGKISNNTATAGCGGGVHASGDLVAINMERGIIEKNSAYAGGGVYLDEARLDLYGGEISGNTVQDNTASGGEGGGIHVRMGSLSMHGGAVERNSASWRGGGVYVYGGDLTLYDGKICGNTAHGHTLQYTNLYSEGGGIYVNSSTAPVQILGGEISGNTAEHFGGGFRAYWSSSSANADQTVITVSGGPKIFGNSSGDDGLPDNVRLGATRNTPQYYQLIAVGDGGLSASASIGVTSSAATLPIPITEATDEAYVNCFAADDSSLYRVEYADGRLQITQGGSHIHAGVTEEFTALSSLSSPLSAGNHYLTGSIVLTDTAETPNGTVRLCLNGRKLTAPEGRPVFKIPAGSHLYLSSCSPKKLSELIGGGSILIEQGGSLTLLENQSPGDTGAQPRTITAADGAILTGVDKNGQITSGHQNHNGVTFHQIFDKNKLSTKKPVAPIPIRPDHEELYYYLPAGNYYMASDAELDMAMEVQGETNFCLFDHSLTAYNETWEYDMDHVFWVPDKSVLNVYDCACDLRVVWLYGGSVHLRGSGKFNLITGENEKYSFALEGGDDVSGTFTFEEGTGTVSLPPNSVLTRTVGSQTAEIARGGETVTITPAGGGRTISLDLPQEAQGTGQNVVLLSPNDQDADKPSKDDLVLKIPAGTGIQAGPDAPRIVLDDESAEPGMIDTAGNITAKKITVSAPADEDTPAETVSQAVIAAPGGETLKASVNGTVDFPAGSTITTGKISLTVETAGGSGGEGGGKSQTGQFNAGGVISLAPGSKIEAEIAGGDPGGTSSRTIVIALPAQEGSDSREELFLVDNGIELPAGSELQLKRQGKTIVIALPYPEGGGDQPVWFDEGNNLILPDGTTITEDGEEPIQITPENNTFNPETGEVTHTEDVPNMPDRPVVPDRPAEPEEDKKDIPAGGSVTAEDGTKIERSEDGTITITPPGGGDEPAITLKPQNPADSDPAPKADKDGNVYVEGAFQIQTDDGKPEITVKPSPGDKPAKVSPEGAVELPNGGEVTVPKQGGDPDTPIKIEIPNGGGTIVLTPDGKITLPPGAKVTVDGNEVTVPSAGGSVDPSTGKVTVTTPPGPDWPGYSGGGSGGGTNSKPSETKGTGDCPRDRTCPIWPYTDAVPNAWYHDGVHFCIEAGLMVGTSTSPVLLFEPDIPLTRAMAVQVLYNWAGCPRTDGENPFRDVAPSAWYDRAITWAAKEKVVFGYGDGRFGPEDPVTREQLAAMLWRNAKQPASQHGLAFSDSDRISGYAIPALRWSTEKEIVYGYPNGLLIPQGNATRAEAAQMFYRYFNR